MIALWNYFIRYPQSCHYATPEFFSVILLNIAGTIADGLLIGISCRCREGGWVGKDKKRTGGWEWGNTDGL
jgi:hypothetical protein